MGQNPATEAARLRRSLAANPNDRVGWHNLAAAERGLGRAAEAESAARRAIALGIPAPETRLVLARALQDLNRLDEAERAFEDALALKPAYAQAHLDLAQLRWMRTGRADPALRALDDALRKNDDVQLHLVRAIALEFIGERSAALSSAEAGLARAPQDLQLLRHAAHLSAESGEGARALAFAQRAAGLAPTDAGVLVALCEALLAAGQVAQAEPVAARLRGMDPLDQHAVALQATAWRLLGDERYGVLHDYPRLVHAETLPAPQGWPSLEAFLDELAADLAKLHRYGAHPFQQSVRGGGQLPLTAQEMARPTLRALFQIFQHAVDRRLAGLAAGSDPFSARNTGRAAISGAWSVRLVSGGYHTDHVHPRGWLSSAFYVALPRVMAPAAERAGWLRLGKPGIATVPPLAADHYVKPEPGKLVLFPSYMWHGVERFESAEARLTVAFDALPA